MVASGCEEGQAIRRLGVSVGEFTHDTKKEIFLWALRLFVRLSHT